MLAIYLHVKLVVALTFPPEVFLEQDAWCCLPVLAPGGLSAYQGPASSRLRSAALQMHNPHHFRLTRLAASAAASLQDK